MTGGSSALLNPRELYRLWSQCSSLNHIGLHQSALPVVDELGTIKCYNGRNDLVIPFIVRVRLYVCLVFLQPIPHLDRLLVSTRQERAVSAFEVEAGNRVVCPPWFPEISFVHIPGMTRGPTPALPVPDLSAALAYP
ncbi:hypothetical protein V8E36_007407 [Tilletia maclaganii]